MLKELNSTVEWLLEMDRADIHRVRVNKLVEGVVDGSLSIQDVLNYTNISEEQLTVLLKQKVDSECHENQGINK